MGDNVSLADISALLNNRGGNGFGGDDGLLLLVIILLFGGWGNRGYGNQGSYGAGGVGGNELYPWLNQSEQISDGFRDQMLNTGINGIQNSVTNGFANVQQSLCAGFAGVANGFSQTQMAMLQGFNGIQAQQAQCCCDNQLATANQTAALMAEHCADRTALSNGVRDVIESNNAGFQRILDQMCQDKIDAKNEEIAQLRTQINILNLAASQNAQTAQILANNEAQTAALERYLAPNPIPAYVVQNPNCCGQAYGCGCAA